MNDCISENSRKRIACGCLMTFLALGNIDAGEPGV